MRYETLLWNDLDAALKAERLPSMSEVWALRVIDGLDGAARVQDLRQALAITVGATSKFVDRLERNGLVRRAPHPSDRRSSLLALTEPARDQLKSALRVVDARLILRIPAEFGDPARLWALIARFEPESGEGNPGGAPLDPSVK
ncbi:MAG: hypothetical protein K0Q52_7 [Microbacterium sp.]|nr:hypothetical protein [Microbacterium sp.]